MREALQEKEDAKNMKAKMREKVNDYIYCNNDSNIYIDKDIMIINYCFMLISPEFVMIMIMIIQLTPHQGFSVTNYFFLP